MHDAVPPLCQCQKHLLALGHSAAALPQTPIQRSRQVVTAPTQFEYNGEDKSSHTDLPQK
eukprot:3772849-Amphidinium_carterae.1